MNLLFISTILYVLIAGSPEGPVTGPQLVTTGPGLFQLKHTVSAPAQNTVHPVGLVYHIVDILTRVTVFMSQVKIMAGEIMRMILNIVHFSSLFLKSLSTFNIVKCLKHTKCN